MSESAARVEQLSSRAVEQKPTRKGFNPSSALFRIYIGFILLMLYFPFVIMAILSFQGPRGGHTFPLKGVSSWWWWKLFRRWKLFSCWR